MKILCFKGGLGNQLFEYCRYQQLKATGQRVFLFYDYRQLKQHGGILLNECFDVHLPPATIPITFFTLLLKGIRKIGPFPKLFDEDNPNCLLIDDYCQDRSFISEALVLLPFRKDRCQQIDTIWLRQIENISCSVAVHIRRGDYLHRVNAPNFGICSEEYYQRAIRMIRQYHPEAKLFFFSDDICWCRKHLKYENSHYIEHKNKQPDWVVLYLITRCRHHIIANSTFSFWGAYLSRHPHSINIYPRNWYANPEWITPDIFPKEWIAI